MRFAELAVTTNFNFLRGGSHAEELVVQAKELGLAAIGVADCNTLAGVVRAHAAAKTADMRLLVGARIVTQDGFELIAYPEDRFSYGRLSKLVTLGRRRAPKGECYLMLEDVLAMGGRHCFIVMPPDILDAGFVAQLKRVAQAFPGALWLAQSFLYRGDSRQRMQEVMDLAQVAGVPLVATNDVLYHVPGRRPLQDVLTCIREHQLLSEGGFLLESNGERHLKTGEELSPHFTGCPEAIGASLEIMQRCTFSLDELAYEYPDDTFDDGLAPQDLLKKLTWEGAADRYPDGVPSKVEKTISHELELIDELSYAPYFLTVYDIVRFARSQDILCQGRGSAANSAVCFCLGITSVDPSKIDLLFERFISTERNEPPDIDVDFEHERREEVIQYIYNKYGRHRAGLAATVIRYRARSAVRDVGKVLGLSEDVVGALAKMAWGWSSKVMADEQVRQAGLDPTDEKLRMALVLTAELIGFPRHLSQHVGGFVITKGPLDEVVPIQNAAMEGRTVVEWDKDDLDTLGILKIDVLALGMLSCIRRAFDFMERHYGVHHNLASVPPEDSATYDMLCEADSVGVFQVESRAQMTMLPRLRPRTFYDLVIEVSIVRPGPIQGGMVHPYLRRRHGEEEVVFPSKELEEVLGKTLGVPLFQEQAMKIAIVAAGFTPAEADRLRRAMATFRKVGIIHEFGEKLVRGMVERGYEEEFAQRCFKQIEGFGEYGFPESHAASFALLVYVSAWLKCHYPDVFCAALLNSQPMGFYAPAQLVRDARDHGVDMLPADINHSDWDCTLEPVEGAQASGRQFAVRLGMRQIKGLRHSFAEQIMDARGQGYDSVRDLWLRTGLAPSVLERLANADAFVSLGLDRRGALWAVRGLGQAEGRTTKPAPLPLFVGLEEGGFQAEPDVYLPPMPPGEQVAYDYAAMRLSLKAHPLHFLRRDFRQRGIVTHDQLGRIDDGRAVSLGGLVLVRQRPGTASGVIFATLEDETGVANIIIWPKVFEKYRRIVLQSRLLRVRGRVQKESGVIHVIAHELEDYTHHLLTLTSGGEGVGDEVLKPGQSIHQQGSIDGTLRHVSEEQLRAARLMPPSRDFH